MKNKLRRNSLIIAFVVSSAVAVCFWLGFFINFIFLRIEGHFLRWRGTSVET